MTPADAWWSPSRALIEPDDALAVIERQRLDDAWSYGLLYDLRLMTGRLTLADLRPILGWASQRRTGRARVYRDLGDRPDRVRDGVLVRCPRTVDAHDRGISRPRTGRAVALRSGEGDRKRRDVMMPERERRVFEVFRPVAGAGFLSTALIAVRTRLPIDTVREILERLRAQGLVRLHELDPDLWMVGERQL